MNAEPSSDNSREHTSWRAPLVTLVVTITAAITVLGAILLSLQGQDLSGQPVVRQQESQAVELIPTAAIATPLPVTFMPTVSSSNAAEPTREASSTPQDEAPVLSPEIGVTPALAETTTSGPAPTPWPCAGFAPMGWGLYIVQRGDTLFSLAHRHETSMNEVIYYNCLTSDQVWVGQRLYLPAPQTPIPTASVTLTPTASSTPTPQSQPSPSPTLLPSSTAILTSTATPSGLPSVTATDTARPTQTVPVDETSEPTATATATPTATPTPTALPSPLSTERPTAPSAP